MYASLEKQLEVAQLIVDLLVLLILVLVQIIGIVIQRLLAVA